MVSTDVSSGHTAHQTGQNPGQVALGTTIGETGPVGPVGVSWAFLVAGKAIWTVENGKGDHYTFKIEQGEPRTAGGWIPYFVSLLTGPQNTTDYTYLGMLDPIKGDVRLTKASRYTDDSRPVRVVRWALKIIRDGGPLPTGYGIHHEGRCGRCGRLLTVPESIKAGIGPECAGKL